MDTPVTPDAPNMGAVPTLKWKKGVAGVTYADSPTNPIRYRVYKDPTAKTPWVVEALATITVAGVTVADPHARPLMASRHHDTRGLARAVAEEYDVAPQHHPNRQNRLTRAINAAYSRP